MGMADARRMRKDVQQGLREYNSPIKKQMNQKEPMRDDRLSKGIRRISFVEVYIFLFLFLA